MEKAALRKRKAVTKDVENDPAIVSGDEFEVGQLDGTISDEETSESGDESDSNSELEGELSSDEEEYDDEDILDSDEIPSADEDDEGGLEKVDGADPQSVDIKVMSQEKLDDGSEDEKPNYRIEKGANGEDRYVYDEINPDDNSDFSDVDEAANTIGNIPLSFYDQYPHIGYNINGKKIMRPAKGQALDALLDSIDVPKGWTGLTDPNTGKPLQLSQEELQLLRKIQQNEFADETYNPYEPTVEYFTSKTEIMPLTAAPEPKRRFVPSKHEQKRIMKIVRAIREGRIQPYKPPEEEKEEDEGIQKYDIWADEQPRPDHIMHVPAPKLPPPGFEESYHPPPEYIPDKAERKAWEEADEEDREKDFLPTDHDSLRKVPGYERFVKEKFERCLDLYLAPRVRRSKLNIDPESLLPKLPDPEELKPFPTTCATLFRGHRGRVRSLSIDPSGVWLATGGDDGHVRVWELLTGRQLWSVDLNTSASALEAVNVVRWRPSKESFILAAAIGESIHFCIPLNIVDPGFENTSLEILDAGFGHGATSTNPSTKEIPSSTWARPSTSLIDSGVHLTLTLAHVPRTLSFHRHGNYFVTVSPSSSTPASQAISIHTLSKHLTQHPFKRRLKGGGPAQTAQFHPSKPILFVANQRVIRAYDLSRQTLLKIIQPGARWISSFDIHPTAGAASSDVSGDNLIVSSYDRKLLYMDLDLSPRPYKTLRYHSKAIRSARYHPRLPLFADASDDGTIQIFHAEVSSDAMSNVRIVPLKVLKGHRIDKQGLGVMEVDWHPREAWCVSVGADGTARLWM
ncbi:putative eukaryotic ribosome biogenesis protein 1 [Phaeomoniella chlamydospora]|uniref:Ribosome biogenesis protein ERB1 n=1 Tax=Phaeomoniella chlamydospora TaxID=158046 RepID=A0A0G2GLL9_PHACM|nr:putative eukaryotic ribosome biogenesis protein 1 [Phaeomoniella chlamydospora]